MDTGYFFDNVLIASDPAAAAAYRTSHWAPKLAAEVGKPLGTPRGIPYDAISYPHLPHQPLGAQAGG